MKKKLHKKLPKDSSLSSPALALLGLIPIFLFGYLFLSIIEEKTVAYRESKIDLYPYTPVYYPPLEPSKLPPAQTPQAQIKKDDILDIERANRDAQEQMERFKSQREQLKTQRTFFPL